ncbi:NAD(P)H-binding protein [Streptomyces sp. NPDC004237]|uniref:SDR family oxidoreductase n=1 Tax=Streptomyces sp. NPDC004237 TaxID=3154455 RepID=UPI0033A96BC8
MITVTGATGNIGRTLVDLLAQAGEEEVVAVSRRDRPATPDAPAVPGAPAAPAVSSAPTAPAVPGVRWIRADAGNAESMRPALTGARALFLVLGGELNAHGESPTLLLDTAVSAGVERVVLVSSQVSATRPDAPSHARLRAFEAAVRASGLDFTILRPGGFASNALAWAETIRTRRTAFAPFADTALPVVDPADIAAVAAAALREDGHGGRAYELTGPAPISPREQVRAIAEALAEEVTLVELSREEAHAAMTRFMPEEAVTGTLDVLGEPLAAESKVSGDVEAVLGRPAGSFGGWAGRNAAAFK